MRIVSEQYHHNKIYTLISRSTEAHIRFAALQQSNNLLLRNIILRKSFVLMYVSVLFDLCSC